MDYGLDKQTGKYEAADRKKDLMDEYLKWFCEENAVETTREDTEFNRGERKHEKKFIKLLWIVRDCGIFVLYGSSCFFSYGISGV